MANAPSLGFLSIGYVGVRLLLSYLNMPLLAGVRLETYEYEEVFTSKVSQQMIIDFQNGRSLITDNIAPMPRTWNLSAYIGSATIAWSLTQGAADSINQFAVKNNFQFLKDFASTEAISLPGIEPSVFFMPSLKQQYEILKKAWLTYKLIFFVTKYKELVAVAIEDMKIKSDPTIQNKLVISVTLKEVITYNGNQNSLATGSATIANDVTNPASSSVNLGGSVANPVNLSA